MIFSANFNLKSTAFQVFFIFPCYTGGKWKKKEGLPMYPTHHFRQDFHYLSLRSSLLEELSLLYGLPLGQAKGQAGRICRCRHMVRELLAACRQQPDQPEYPYLLGVLLERAGQWPLTSRPRWAYDQAEGYYDRARQLQQRQPPGTYDRQHYLRPSVALLRLSLRRRQEERSMTGGTAAAACAAFTAMYRPCSRCAGSSSRKTMNGRPLPSGICRAWPAGIALFQRPGPGSYQISSRRPVRGRGRY